MTAYLWRSSPRDGVPGCLTATPGLEPPGDAHPPPYGPWTLFGVVAGLIAYSPGLDQPVVLTDLGRPRTLQELVNERAFEPIE